ncbi:MAG: serine/threonine-protein kinase [Planctomycetota bacterium]
MAGDVPNGSARSARSDLSSFGLEDGDERWMELLRDAETPIALGSLGAYELIEEVSRGGQGVVYRARDPHRARDVALKRLIAGTLATRTMRHRFAREIEAVSTLDHPGIVTVVGLDVVDDQPVLAMEWIDGVPITGWATDGTSGRRAPGEIARMARLVCAAVHHAHQRGVIHRDLKPSNILVDACGVPRVLDFGLAKLEAIDERSDVTRSGQFVGTPAYSSPEQLRGRADAMDVRSDVYSLGVVLYEMLTGRLPHAVNGNVVEALELIDRAAPARPDVDRELGAIVLKALDRDRDERYQSVDALGRDLDRYLAGEPVEAGGATAFTVLRKAVRRHKVPVAIVTAFVTLALGFGATMAVLYHRSEREAAKAQRIQQFLEDTLVSARPSETGREQTVLEMLALASQRIDAELGGHPEAEAGVRHTLGSVYAGFWKWREAEPHVRRALAIHRELHGDDSAEVATCLVLLGRVLAQQGRLEAIEAGREALAIRRDLHAADHPMVAEAAGSLGASLWRCGGPDAEREAETLFREALQVYRGSGRAHLDARARVTGDFARFLEHRGAVEEADAVYRDALALYEDLSARRVHPDDVSMVRCMDDHARLLEGLGRYDEAAALLEASWKRTPQGLGQGRTPYQMWAVGRGYHARGELAKAQHMYRQSLALSARRMAAKYPVVSDRLSELAFRLFRNDAAPAPVDAYEQVFETMIGLENVSAHQLAVGLHDLGRVLMDAGELDGAERLLRRGLDLALEALPEDHELPAQIARTLAELD